jgi:glutathione synthase
MKLGLLLNRDLREAGATTRAIGARLKQRGHRLVELPVRSLELSSSNELHRGRHKLNDLDGILVRTSPGRDPAQATTHALALSLLATLDGPVILNDPRVLQATGSKLWLNTLPESLRPRTWMTRSPQSVRRILDDLGEVVIKPLSGSGGRGVVRLDQSRADQVSALVELLAEQGPVLVQELISEASEGDVRVLVLDGRILGMVRRRPGAGEFRSNVSRGGTPEEARLTAVELEAAERLARATQEAGLWLAGIDLIGTRAVEVNVFSPGGFEDAGRFSGRDLVGELCEEFERAVQDRG